MNIRQQMDKDQKEYMEDLYVKDAKHLLKVKKGKNKKLKRSNFNSGKNR